MTGAQRRAYLAASAATVVVLVCAVTGYSGVGVIVWAAGVSLARQAVWGGRR